MPRHCLDSPGIDILSPSPPTVSPITLLALHSSDRGHHSPSPYRERAREGLDPCTLLAHTHTQLPPRPRTAPRTEGPGTPKGDAPRSMPAMARGHHGEVPFLPRQASRSEERRITCFAVARDALCAARWRERALWGSCSRLPYRWSHAPERRCAKGVPSHTGHVAGQGWSEKFRPSLKKRCRRVAMARNGRSLPTGTPPRGEAKGGAGTVVRAPGAPWTKRREGKVNTVHRRPHVHP